MAENLHLRAIKSFYSLQHGGIVTLEDDVLSIVRQVREDYGGKVSVQLDPDTGWYHFVAHEDDNTDRLIFSVEELDPRALERLRRSDSHARGFQDPYDAVEREQDELERQRDAQFRGELRDRGERLLHGLKKDGLAPRMPTTVVIPAGVRSLDA